MTCKIMHQICYSFYWRIRKCLKLVQKMMFSLIVSFLFMPSYTLRYTPKDFAKWKTLLRYLSVVTFIRIAYVVVKLKVFCIESGWNSPSFGDFLGPYSHKWDLILLTLWPEEVSNEKNRVWKILQNFESWLKWNTPIVYIFGLFWGPIYCWKAKNIAKTQNFCKNCTLMND